MTKPTNTPVERFLWVCCLNGAVRGGLLKSSPTTFSNCVSESANEEDGSVVLLKLSNKWEKKVNQKDLPNHKPVNP